MKKRPDLADSIGGLLVELAYQVRNADPSAAASAAGEIARILRSAVPALSAPDHQATPPPECAGTADA